MTPDLFTDYRGYVIHCDTGSAEVIANVSRVEVDPSPKYNLLDTQHLPGGFQIRVTGCVHLLIRILL